jgi:HEAT repeat protein
MRPQEVYLDSRQHRRPRLVQVALCVALGLGASALSEGGRESARGAVQESSNAAAAAEGNNSAGRAAQLFGEARTLFENENWPAAAAKFEEFIAGHPRDKNADAALYWLATLLKKQERFQEAGQALGRLMKEFPQSSWASDARVMRAELASSTGDKRVIEEILEDEDEDVRLVALQSLVRLEPARAAAFAAGVLKPGSGASLRMKLAVVALLGNSGRGQATPLLIDVVRRETDQKLRKAAIYALGRGGDQSTLEFLKGLVVPGDDEIAKSAAFSIAQLPGARSSEFLGEVARTTASREMRRNVITWLAQQDNEVAVGELVNTFYSVEDVETKGLCLLSLGQSGNPRAQAKLAEVARDHGQPEIRMHAILGLGIRGEDGAISSLIALYDAEQDETVKEWVLAALGQAGQKRGLRKLMDVASSNASARLRKAALASLTRASGDPAVDKFLRERQR